MTFQTRERMEKLSNEAIVNQITRPKPRFDGRRTLQLSLWLLIAVTIMLCGLILVFISSKNEIMYHTIDISKSSAKADDELDAVNFKISKLTSVLENVERDLTRCINNQNLIEFWIEKINKLCPSHPPFETRLGNQFLVLENDLKKIERWLSRHDVIITTSGCEQTRQKLGNF